MALDKQLTPSQYFHVAGGPSLPSVAALGTYLRRIPSSQFNHHVSKRKNDFAKWIEEAFGDSELAERVSTCPTGHEMANAIENSLSAMKRPAKTAPPADGEPKGAQVAIDSKALEDDAIFREIKDEVVERNEKLGQKYEDIAKSMRQALSTAFPEELEKLSDALKSRYDDLMMKISETRRSGKDTLIPALIIRQFPAKLALAKATRETRDFKFAETVLHQAEFELREVREEKEMDFKKEVLALAGVGDGAKKK